MRRYYTVALITLCVLGLVPSGTYAVSSVSPETKAPPIENNEDLNNQNQTVNKGQDYQIQIQEKTEIGAGAGKKSVLDPFLGVNAVESAATQAQYRSSDVAKQVQNLLSAQGAAGGIGEQVNAFAREQNMIQERVQVNLQEIEKRSHLLRLIIGPNYGVMEELKGQLESTEQQLDKLEALRSDFPATDQSTVTALQMALQSQQDALKEVISAQEEAFSLFGWSVKAFVRIFGA